MLPRTINISKTKSFFLFGARGTGKSWLLTQAFDPGEAVYIDLLDPALADRLLAYPNELTNILSRQPALGSTSALQF